MRVLGWMLLVLWLMAYASGLVYLIVRLWKAKGPWGKALLIAYACFLIAIVTRIYLTGDGGILYLGAVALLVVAAFVGQLLICTFLWRKRHSFGVAGVTGLVGLTLALLAADRYTMRNPPQSFYEDEFVQVAGIEFPPTGRFKFKYVSDPDFFGDYSSCAIMEVSQEDYELLRSRMQPKPPETPFYTECTDGLNSALGRATLLVERSEYNRNREGEYVYWALVKGRPEIVIQHATW